jgi:hypothetical protein
MVPPVSAAVRLDGTAFDRRSVPRHDNVRRNAAQGGSQGERLGVIAGAVRHHAARRDFRAESHHSVASAAELERADFLKLLAFEKQRASGHAVERRTSHHRRAMSASRESLGSLLNIRNIDCVRRHGKPLNSTSPERLRWVFRPVAGAPGLLVRLSQSIS